MREVCPGSPMRLFPLPFLSPHLYSEEGKASVGRGPRSWQSSLCQSQGSGLPRPPAAGPAGAYSGRPIPCTKGAGQASPVAPGEREGSRGRAQLWGGGWDTA